MFLGQGLVIFLNFCLCLAIKNGIKTYDIGHFDDTIINPLFPSHSIPVYVYYPIASSSDSSNTYKDTTFPSIVFGHGYQCDAAWYSWIYQDIVGLGYIVAYIDSYAPPSPLNQTQFAIDQRYTLQWLNTIVNNNKSSPLYSKINTDKSMASGHSEGGGASILGNGSEYINKLFDNKYNFNSIFTLAPCGQGSADTALAAQNVNIPVFVFTGTMDCICPSEEAYHLFNNINGNNVCKYYGDVINGTHCGWLSDDFFEKTCSDIEKDLCQELHRNEEIEFLSDKEQTNIASEYMQLFLIATIVNDNSKNDFENITNQLNNDKNSGKMSKVVVSETC